MKERRLRNNFFAGLAVILPAIVTILVVYWLAIQINRGILSPILKLEFFSPFLADTRIEILIKIAVFLVIILVLFFAISAIGLAARNIIIRRAFGWGERLIFRMPMINKIYATTRQISSAFLEERSSAFRRVVLVQYPRPGLYSIGFVTSAGKGEIQSHVRKRLLTVFIPTSPNPTSGMMILVPEQEVVPLAMSVGEGMKLVVSAGAVVPPYKVDELRGKSPPAIKS